MTSYGQQNQSKLSTAMFKALNALSCILSIPQNCSFSPLPAPDRLKTKQNKKLFLMNFIHSFGPLSINRVTKPTTLFIPSTYLFKVLPKCELCARPWDSYLGHKKSHGSCQVPHENFLRHQIILLKTYHFF